MNNGYAYTTEDVDCPTYQHTWRRGGSNQFLNGVHVDIFSSCLGQGQTHAQSVGLTSATSGVNMIILKGQYKKICRPVYKNGKFKCS